MVYSKNHKPKCCHLIYINVLVSFYKIAGAHELGTYNKVGELELRDYLIEGTVVGGLVNVASCTVHLAQQLIDTHGEVPTKISCLNEA
jgi:hypothetical protein